MYRRLMTRINNRIFVALVLVLLAVTGFAALQNQPRRGQSKEQGQEQFDKAQFPIVEEYAFRAKTKEEQVKSALKAKRFRMVMPAVSEGVLAGVHHWPLNFSALPVAESTTIVIGDVTDSSANLSDDRMAVYSDFTINPVTVLKDTPNSAKDHVPLIASRYGGRVRFQNGKTLLVFDSGLGMPQPGRRYLFFLKQTNADFELLTAYEIKAAGVLPIDSGSPNFDAYRNVSEAALVKEVQQKIESLSKTTLN